jgi:RNA polymerase sigma-70 factor (ECF subfamily)
VRAWCLNIARRYATADEAEDIAQESALRAWRSRGTCRSPERPWPWLATITHHEAIRRRRRALPASGLEELPERGEPDDALESAADRLTLWPAVAELGERDRQIVLLHYRAGMTVADIGEEFGMPTGTVKVKLLRIRDKLRTALT